MENTWHVHFDVFVVIAVVAVVVIGNTIEQCCQQLKWIKTFVIALYSQFYYSKLGHPVMYVVCQQQVSQLVSRSVI